MDILNIQALITENRVVTLSDIAPTNSWIQIGVWQGGSKRASGNADLYRSYVIQVSELIGGGGAQTLTQTLALGNTTSGQNISITAGDVILFNEGSGGGLSSLSTTGIRTWNLPDKSGTIALVSDITDMAWLQNGNTNGVLKYIGTNDNIDFPFRTNGIEYMRITNSGFVGIGISTPSQTLHVEVPVGGFGIRTSTGVNYVDIVPQGSNFIELLTNRDGYEFISNIASLRLNRSGGVGQALIYGNNLNSIVIGDNSGTPIMTALYSNNSIGIGTGAPTAKLHVNGFSATAADYAMKIENSGAVNLISARNDGIINMGLLPIAAGGLAAGDIWNNAGVLNII